MRIGEVIGTVTLNDQHSMLSGGRLKLIAPYSLVNLSGDQKQRSEALVAYDELGAGIGSVVAFSESREAANPFHPSIKPIDAYIAAILDVVEVTSNLPQIPHQV